MADAADYLILTQNSQPFTQVASTYKLRTRSTNVVSFTATNIAPNYTLSTIIEPNVDGVIVTPNSFTLTSGSSTQINVSFDTNILETYSPGLLEGLLTATVTAVPTIFPETPQAPAPPNLPTVPTNIVSRIEITPSTFTFTSLNETKQLQAILYVDGVPVQNGVVFGWEMRENLGDAFEVSTIGTVTSLKRGIYTGTVAAKIISPSEYIGTVGLASVGANIPVITPQDPTNPQPAVTTGTITVNVSGLPVNVAANVSVTGVNTPLTTTTTLSNLAPGNYTVTPNVVTIGGESYIPNGGGATNIQAGESKQVTVTYELQAPIDVNSISLLELRGPKGDLIQESRAFVGETITVIAQTYKNGTPTTIGPIQFNVSGTTLGTQTITPVNAPGRAEAVFNVIQGGTLNVSVSCAGKTATTTITAIDRGQYTIRFNAPQQIYAGQCTAVTAMVYDGDTPLPNIPVTITADGGVLSDTPCGLPPEETGATGPRTAQPRTTTTTVTTTTSSGGDGGTGERDRNNPPRADRPANEQNNPAGPVDLGPNQT